MKFTRVGSISLRRMSSSPSGRKLSPGPILGVDEAKQLHAKDERVRFLDASWFMSNSKQGIEQFTKERIKGANFFDINDVADQSSSLPHMLPTVQEFEGHMNRLGVANDSPVVVYNQPNSASAARCWWTMKVFGHTSDVFFLNGGLTAWKEAGGAVESGPVQSASVDTPYKVSAFQSELVADKESVLSAVSTGMQQICDARSEDRFLGRVDEPRPGLARGHIPGSLNVPYTKVLDPSDPEKFRDFHELRKIFDDAGLVAGSRVIFTCGSGVTAAILALAWVHAGADMSKFAVYDGSWSEWGADDNTPKMTE